jgi:hypothetical protein
MLYEMINLKEKILHKLSYKDIYNSINKLFEQYFAINVWIITAKSIWKMILWKNGISYVSNSFLTGIYQKSVTLNLYVQAYKILTVW